jgi:hypothetical protein
MKHIIKLDVNQLDGLHFLQEASKKMAEKTGDESIVVNNESDILNIVISGLKKLNNFFLNKSCSGGFEEFTKKYVNPDAKQITN